MKRNLALISLVSGLALSSAMPVMATTISSNITATTNRGAIVSNSSWQAQSFTTDLDSFRITDVSLKIWRQDNALGSVFLSIYDSQVNGEVGDEIVPLADIDVQNLVSDPNDVLAVFDLTNLDVKLLAAHDYYLVLGASNLDHSVFWGATNSTSGTGFPSAYSSSSNGGQSWNGTSFVQPHMMAINADNGLSAPPINDAPVAPELDASAGTGALAMMAGILALVGERRRRV